MDQKEQLAKIASAVEKGSSMEKAVERLGWRGHFDERQRRLISNCVNYSLGDPAGMPGHALALIIAEMAEILDDI